MNVAQFVRQKLGLFFFLARIFIHKQEVNDNHNNADDQRDVGDIKYIPSRSAPNGKPEIFKLNKVAHIAQEHAVDTVAHCTCDKHRNSYAEPLALALIFNKHKHECDRCGNRENAEKYARAHAAEQVFYKARAERRGVIVYVVNVEKLGNYNNGFAAIDGRINYGFGNEIRRKKADHDNPLHLCDFQVLPRPHRHAFYKSPKLFDLVCKSVVLQLNSYLSFSGFNTSIVSGVIKNKFLRMVITLSPSAYAAPDVKSISR